MCRTPGRRGKRWAVAVVGLAVLSLAGVGGAGRALADDPLAPTTRLGRPAHVVHHRVTGVGYRANGPAGTIGVLDPRTGGVVREIEVGQRVDLVALSEDGLWLYAFSPSADRLVVIALATERVVRRVPLAGGTKGVKQP